MVDEHMAYRLIRIAIVLILMIGTIRNGLIFVEPTDEKKPRKRGFKHSSFQRPYLSDSSIKPCPRRHRDPHHLIPAQPCSNRIHILMMPRLQRRIQKLRMQIANQRNPPMPQRDTPFKQGQRRIGIALFERALGQQRGRIA
jgi:hypothetical protein